jgi:hypothetical protein
MVQRSWLGKAPTITTQEDIETQELQRMCSSFPLLFPPSIDDYIDGEYFDDDGYLLHDGLRFEDEDFTDDGYLL